MKLFERNKREKYSFEFAIRAVISTLLSTLIILKWDTVLRFESVIFMSYTCLNKTN